MRPQHIMADIDDVLFPLAPALHSKAHEMGLHDGTDEALTVWHGHKQYGCAVEDWHRVFYALEDEGYYTNAQPIPGSVEALRRLSWEGHFIHLVTARGFAFGGDDDVRANAIRGYTPEWIEEFAVPHHSLTFARNKVQAQDDLGVRFDFAIDDGDHNYHALDKGGVRVYLLDQPHNRMADVPPGRRVNSVGEFADIVLALQEAA